MEVTELTYPDFVADQVLTSAHLNALREYLDEQNRLTRANLIGIGIACGLQTGLPAPDRIRLTRGVGVTSEGYLVVEPEDVDLVTARPYVLPDEYGYPPFLDDTQDPARQVDLWELFPDDDEPGAVPLTQLPVPLTRAAVVLFLELRRQGQRQCLPNSCDGLGTEVTGTVRRLLVARGVLDRIRAAGAASEVPVEPADRLTLPELRMPRFDVPATGPATSDEVLAGFAEGFRRHRLAADTGKALSGLYAALRPLLARDHPTDPFTGFGRRFGFLDSGPRTAAQTLALPVYWDLFDDLLTGYAEVRERSVDLLCVCVPPAGLFPRHLVAGGLGRDGARLRQGFLASPAVRDGAERSGELGTLFRRLVRMVDSFVEAPEAEQVRVTPSRGAGPLGERAVPFHYGLGGDPPVYQVWDPVKAALGRGHLNLGYRAAGFVPAPPAFVTDPLGHDLSGHDFLRIEGHLGRDVRDVLRTLLTARADHRLPFEVVALRAGLFDEDVPVDLAADGVGEDLQVLYRTLRAELLCFLGRQVRYFYALPVEAGGDEAVPVTLPLLTEQAPGLRAAPNTLGYLIEAVRHRRVGRERLGRVRLPDQTVELVYALAEFADALPAELTGLDPARFTALNSRVVDLARQVDAERRTDQEDAPGLAGRLDDLVFRCRAEALQALAEELRRRTGQARRAQYLAPFLADHPGIQHKAGVPVGGTFVLVYHSRPSVLRGHRFGRRVGELNLGELNRGWLSRLRGAAEPAEAEPGGAEPAVADEPAPGVQSLRAGRSGRISPEMLAAALDRLQFKEAMAQDPDVQVLFEAATGQKLFGRIPPTAPDREVFQTTVAGLAEGTVIADFFLPYSWHGQGPAVRFTLPPAPLSVRLRRGCTSGDLADVVVEVSGAQGPVTVQLDDGQPAPLTGPVQAAVGEHTVTVRDGDRQAQAALTIPPALGVDPGGQQPQADGWVGTATLTGGTPPYTADSGTVEDATWTGAPVPTGQGLIVVFTDAGGCTLQHTFDPPAEQPCALPCEGRAVRAGYRFWLPETAGAYELELSRFSIMAPDGTPLELADEVRAIVDQRVGRVPRDRFPAVVQAWLDECNALFAARLGSDQWFRMDYEAADPDDGYGTLFVERLECVDFSARLLVRLSQARGDGRTTRFTYDSAGTELVDVDTDAAAHLPPYDGWTADKCHPEQPPVPRCAGTNLTLRMHAEGSPELLVLAAIWGGEEPAALLWEVQDGHPAVSAEEKVEVRLDPVEPTEKRVRLTAVSKAGCLVSTQTVVDTTALNG